MMANSLASTSTAGFAGLERSNPLSLLATPLLVGSRGGLEVAGVACRGVLGMESLLRSSVLKTLAGATAGASWALGVVAPFPTSSSTSVETIVLDEHTTFTKTSSHAARHLKVPRHGTGRSRSPRGSDNLCFSMDAHTSRRAMPDAHQDMDGRMPMQAVLGLQASML